MLCHSSRTADRRHSVMSIPDPQNRLRGADGKFRDKPPLRFRLPSCTAKSRFRPVVAHYLALLLQRVPILTELILCEVVDIHAIRAKDSRCCTELVPVRLNARMREWSVVLTLSRPAV